MVKIFAVKISSEINNKYFYKTNEIVLHRIMKTKTGKQFAEITLNSQNRVTLKR